MPKNMLKYLGMILVSLLIAKSHANSEYLNQLIATGMDGDILVTVKGYGRNQDGLLSEIRLNFTNKSETEVYELLLDDRIVRQHWIMIIEDGRPLNNPLEGFDQQAFSNVSFNLVTLGPKQVFPFIIKIESAANVESDVYGDIERIDIRLYIDLPIYAEGSHTDRDDRLGMIQVRSLLEAVPVFSANGE